MPRGHLFHLAALVILMQCIPWGWRVDGVIGSFLQQSGKVLRPAETMARIDATYQEERNDWDLPTVRKVVGDRPVCFWGYSQWILFHNGLSPWFSPIFQPIHTSTDHLLRLNAESLLAADGPEFVLAEVDPWGGRHPTMEDGLFIRALPDCFEFVCEEKGLVLFRKRGTVIPSDERDVWAKRISFGDRIELEPGDEPRCLAVSVRETWLCKALKFFYRVPPIHVDVFLRSGVRRTFRIVPGMCRSGLLVDPFIEDTAALKEWVRSRRGPRVEALCIRFPDHYRRYAGLPFALNQDLHLPVRSSWLYEPQFEARLFSLHRHPSNG